MFHQIDFLLKAVDLRFYDHKTLEFDICLFLDTIKGFSKLLFVFFEIFLTLGETLFEK